MPAAVRAGEAAPAGPLGPPPKMFFLSLVVVLLAFIPSVIEFGSRVQYPTLRHGTVLVTGTSSLSIRSCRACSSLTGSVCCGCVSLHRSLEGHW